MQRSFMVSIYGVGTGLPLDFIRRDFTAPWCLDAEDFNNCLTALK
jgi:hypothetical protein